jgi:hypothetical protein
MRAYADLGSLDNGEKLTPIETFARYYSFGGTTSAVLKHDRPCLCFVGNRKLFTEAEPRIQDTFRKNPDILKKTTKRYVNQGKRSRKRPSS